MFQKKIQKINEEQKKYLIDNSEYHNFIEARLFKLQESNRDKIRYVSNGINKIDIYIIKGENIKEIRLPYFDKNLQIWKNNLYNIDELKKSKTNQIIDQYSITIQEVKEFKDQNTQELKTLKSEIQNLKSIIDQLRIENQNLKTINEQLQTENQNLKSINEEVQSENQKSEPINEEIQSEINEVSNEDKYVANVVFNNNAILYDQLAFIEYGDQLHYFTTLDQIFGQNFNLNVNNYNIEIIPHFEDERVTYDNSNIYYNLTYLKEYENYTIPVPEPFDPRYQIQLKNDTLFHMAEKQNYNVYIKVTLI